MKILKNKIDKSVVTLGKFDCLHKGHELLISKAREKAKEKNVPLVAYTFSNINKENVFSFEDRLSVFESYGCDFVYVKDFDDELKNMSAEDFFKKSLLEELGALHIVTGDDWRFGKGRTGDVVLLDKLCKEAGIGLTVIDKLYIDGVEVSATKIRELLKSGNITKVNELLGRNYFIKGNVDSGKKLGRQLGFPTVNTRFEEGYLYPLDGVYATRVFVKDRMYISITNIGDNPTFGDKEKRAETHIMDYEGDLYGECVRVEFLERIRGEIKFPDIKSLKCRVEKDIEYVKTKFKI